MTWRKAAAVSVPLAMVASLATSLDARAQLSAGDGAAWCNDCSVLETLSALSAVDGGCSLAPDLLVDLRPREGCASVDVERLGSGQAATCSLQAAVDFVNQRGDPSPGDGEILIGVTGRDPVASGRDCSGTCGGLAGRMARPAGGEVRQRVAIENRNVERLSLVGCGVTLTGGDDRGPVVSITAGVGAVEVMGINVDGPAAEGYRVEGAGAGVGLHQIRVRGTTTGIVIADAGGGTRLEGLTVEESHGDAIVVRGPTDLDLVEVDVLRPGGNGIRATELSGRLSLRRSRISGVDAAGTSGLELVSSGSSPAELLIDETTLSDSRTERSFVLVSAQGDSRVVVTVGNGSRFAGLSGEAMQTVAAGRSRVRTVVRDSVFENAAPDGLNGIVVAASGGAQEVVIEGNSFRDVERPPANAGVLTLTCTAGRLTGSISGNRISRVDGRRGISVVSQPGENASVEALELVLAGNEIDELAEREAIFVDLRSGTERAVVRVRQNRIGLGAGPGETVRGRIGGEVEGVQIRARGPDLGEVHLAVEDNEIEATSVEAALALDVQRQAAVRASVTGNRLVNRGNGLAFAARAAGIDSALCLHLAGNEASGGIVLRGDGGDLQVEGLPAAEARHGGRLRTEGTVRPADDSCWPQ